MHAFVMFVLFHLSLPSPAPLTVCLSCDPWIYPPIHYYHKCASDTQIRIANIAITRINCHSSVSTHSCMLQAHSAKLNMQRNPKGILCQYRYNKL
jgi:hypothetical protein